MRMTLGSVEFCLPGASLKEKVVVAEKHNLWLELVNDKDKDLTILDSYDVDVKSVQAYLLHELSLLSGDYATSKAASRHVKDTIKLACKIGAENVVCRSKTFVALIH